MKNCGRIAVGFASKEASSAKNSQAPTHWLSRKILFFTASALVFGAAIAFPQSARADDVLNVSSIQSALRGDIQPASPASSSDAVAALSSFAQQIDTPAATPNRQIDDQAFAVLQDFAQRLGTEQSQSINASPKMADADSLIDFLQQKGSSSSSAEKPKAPVAATPKYKPAPEATFVDSKVCATCHSAAVAEFQKTLMGRIGMTQKGKFDCQNCHGPGSAHVKAGGGRGVGGMMSFGATDPRTAEEKNAVCLGCHDKGNRVLWRGSVHEERNVSCTNCHTVMKNVSLRRNLKTEFQPDTCFQCHKDRRAQMYRSSHMPMREGKVVCSDCHNPHGSTTKSLLKKNSINEVCYVCHAEKRGPFLFEHMPVRENCDNCHDPHGSVNQFSLKVQRPRLCTECHNLMNITPGSRHSYSVGGSCENCHSAIHGSNSPGGALLFR